MNNDRTAQFSDQKHKNNYHAMGRLKGGSIYLNIGFLLAWSLFLFLLNILYGSEAAISFNG